MQILLSDAAHHRWWERILEVAPEATANRLLADGSWSAGSVEGAEVAWATGELFEAGLTRKFFGGLVHAPTLRWFQSNGAGHDAPVFTRLLEQGVRLSVAHVNAAPIAEHVLWLALDHVLGGPRLRAAAAEHRWDQRSHRELAGTTWTIVGMGAIGSETATRARALGVTVRGVRRTATGDEPVDQLFTPERLLEAVGGADVVVLCVPLDERTTGMADDSFFAALAPGSLFVNVGRGGLVDEAALRRGLDAGRPGHAALDVVATEPLPEDDPLWGDPRVTITPHVAGMSLGNEARLAEVFCANLRAYLAGEPLAHEVKAGS